MLLFHLTQFVVISFEFLSYVMGRFSRKGQDLSIFLTLSLLGMLDIRPFCIWDSSFEHSELV